MKTSSHGADHNVTGSGHLARTFLAHGEEEAMRSFARQLHDTEVIMPALHPSFDLQGDGARPSACSSLRALGCYANLRASARRKSLARCVTSAHQGDRASSGSWPAPSSSIWR